jgi:hypothetical protein
VTYDYPVRIHNKKRKSLGLCKTRTIGRTRGCITTSDAQRARTLDADFEMKNYRSIGKK